VADPLPYPVLFSARVKNVAMPALPGNFGGADVTGFPAVALPGDTLIIEGHRLGGPSVQILFSSLQSQSPRPISLGDHSGDTIEVAIPKDTTGHWPYGYYLLSMRVGQPPLPPPSPVFPPSSTNGVVVALAPQIDTTTPPAAVRKANGDVVVTLHSVQPVLVGQSVSLLLNDQEIPSAKRVGTTTSLSFPGPNLAAGTYTLRLRVDGVDSMPFDRPINPQQLWDPFKNPPAFDVKQQVTI
jgi:hypothetical protein